MKTVRHYSAVNLPLFVDLKAEKIHNRYWQLPANAVKAMFLLTTNMKLKHQKGNIKTKGRKGKREGRILIQTKSKTSKFSGLVLFDIGLSLAHPF